MLTSDFFRLAEGELPPYDSERTRPPRYAENIHESPQPLLGLLIAMLCEKLHGFHVEPTGQEILAQEPPPYPEEEEDSTDSNEGEDSRGDHDPSEGKGKDKGKVNKKADHQTYQVSNRHQVCFSLI